MAVKALLFLVLVGIYACHDIVYGSRLAPDTDPILAAEWQKMEACSGLRGDFADLHVFTTSSIVADGVDKDGLWIAGLNWIILVDRVRAREKTIDHEMIHALLRGGSDHPAHYFNGVCGDLGS